MIPSFSLKNAFCKFTWKTIPLMPFHVLVLTLNYKKSVFEVSWRQKLSFTIVWRHMLSVLIENVILEVRQEKLLITNVSINVSLSSKQKKPWLFTFTWLFTLWHIGNNNQHLNLSHKKNTERFEIATSIILSRFSDPFHACVSCQIETSPSHFNPPLPPPPSKKTKQKKQPIQIETSHSIFNANERTGF